MAHMPALEALNVTVRARDAGDDELANSAVKRACDPAPDQLTLADVMQLHKKDLLRVVSLYSQCILFASSYTGFVQLSAHMARWFAAIRQRTSDIQGEVFELYDLYNDMHPEASETARTAILDKINAIVSRLQEGETNIL